MRAERLFPPDESDARIAAVVLAARERFEAARAANIKKLAQSRPQRGPVALEGDAPAPRKKRIRLPHSARSSGPRDNRRTPEAWDLQPAEEDMFLLLTERHWETRESLISTFNERFNRRLSVASLSSIISPLRIKLGRFGVYVPKRPPTRLDHGVPRIELTPEQRAQVRFDHAR